MGRKNSFFGPFRALREKRFAQLYTAQAISLLGDAFTWLGIALLAFEFGGTGSARILSIALTLRVTAYVIFAPVAGVLADRIDRKKILYITHFLRMAIVATLPFIRTEWQLYVLVFFLNIFNAFFTPAYKASVPQVIRSKENYADALVLSNGTWQLLGMLGPGLAGAMAVFVGARQIFFIDAVTFIIAAILIITLPGTLLVKDQGIRSKISPSAIFSDIAKGTRLLFNLKPLRFAVLVELVVAIAGAQILVNTVGQVKGVMGFGDQEYGWIMTAFGVGATIAAFSSNAIDKSKNRRTLLLLSGTLIISAVIFANSVPYPVLMILWIIAGTGQSFSYLPSQILIAENIELHEQGRVYGAHFAWGHLWWAFGYILAGLAGKYFYSREFLAGGILAAVLFVLVLISSLKKKVISKS
ncbi:MAG: MFS transporter [Bacteroidota bacterium]